MDLAHRRAGSGPPLVLVHGIGSFHHAWDAVFDRLAEEREVIAVDLPGFGDSPVLPETPTVPALAAAVAEFVRGLGHADFHVAGNSLGGGVAFELGRSGAARSLCAVSPIWFWLPRELAYTRFVLRAGRALAKAIRPVADPVLAQPAARVALLSAFIGKPAQMPADAAAAAMRNLADSPGWSDTLDAAIHGTLSTPEQIRCPITIAWGTRDALLLPRQALRAGRVFPDARLVPLHGCGHVPMTDDPELVARVLLEASAG